jgi:hypothetical protein
MQLADKLVEIAVARFIGRRLESSAEGGSDAGMSRRNIDTDNSSIHVEFSLRFLFTF